MSQHTIQAAKNHDAHTMRFNGPVIAYLVNIVGLLWSTYVAMQMANPLLLVLETLTFGIIIGMLIGRKRGNER